MTRSAKVNVFFGDGKHDFQLDIPRLEELQEKVDLGPEALARAIASGNWRAEHLRETIRLGLIGAGMEPEAAFKLVERYAGAGYLSGCKSVAYEILMAAMAGAPDGDGKGGVKSRKRTGGQTPRV
ncbi:MAG: gene transfer agent family protein [Asticcacaulis sp.]